MRLRRSRALVCQQLVEKVSAHLDGDLSPDRAAVEAHLAVCDGCAGYVAQVRLMLERTAAAPGDGEHVLPDVLVASLTARFRARR